MADGIFPGVPNRVGHDPHCSRALCGCHFFLVLPTPTATKVNEATNKDVLLSMALIPWKPYPSGSPPPHQKGFCVRCFGKRKMYTKEGLERGLRLQIGDRWAFWGRCQEADTGRECGNLLGGH